MSLKDNYKTARSVQRLSEEQMYALAVQEIESGQRRDGLWGKAYAESGGNVDKAKAVYIKLRVQSLYDEVHLAGEIEKRRALEKQAEDQRQEVETRIRAYEKRVYSRALLATPFVIAWVLLVLYALNTA